MSDDSSTYCDVSWGDFMEETEHEKLRMRMLKYLVKSVIDEGQTDAEVKARKLICRVFNMESSGLEASNLDDHVYEIGDVLPLVTCTNLLHRFSSIC